MNSAMSEEDYRFALSQISARVAAAIVGAASLRGDSVDPYGLTSESVRVGQELLEQVAVARLPAWVERSDDAADLTTDN